MKFLLIFALALIGFFDLGLANETTPGKKFFDSMPADEKADLLTFSLGDGYTKNSTLLHRTIPDIRFPDALGIDDERLDKFKKLDFPKDFTSNLYVWTRARYNLDQATMRELILRRSVCLSNGECIDMNDIGQLCCPF